MPPGKAFVLGFDKAHSHEELRVCCQDHRGTGPVDLLQATDQAGSGDDRQALGQPVVAPGVHLDAVGAEVAGRCAQYPDHDGVQLRVVEADLVEEALEEFPVGIIGHRPSPEACKFLGQPLVLGE